MLTIDDLAYVYRSTSGRWHAYARPEDARERRDTHPSYPTLAALRAAHPRAALVAIGWRAQHMTRAEQRVLRGE